MTASGSRRSPRRRTWVLSALILALAVMVVVVRLTRLPAVAPRGAAPAEATTVELPTYTILRTPQPIIIDGVLDEAVWSRLQPVGDFRLADGGQPIFETEAKLCWDDHHLFVSFSCVDNDIWSTYTRRDEPLYEQEVVEVFLCPTNDLTHYHEFEVSPRNVIWDGVIYNPAGHNEGMRTDVAWNCPGLLSAVSVVGTLDDRSDLDQRWTVEIAIPFASIAKTPSDGERWRGNLYRIDRGEKDEFSCWSPTLTTPPAFHVPSRFGWLVFSTREA